MEDAAPARLRSVTDDGGGAFTLTRARRSEEETDVLREAMTPPPLRPELAPAPGRPPPTPRGVAAVGRIARGGRRGRTGKCSEHGPICICHLF
jgi:hypothetical protein